MKRIRRYSNLSRYKKPVLAGLTLALMFGGTSAAMASEGTLDEEVRVFEAPVLPDPEQTVTIKGTVTDKDGLPLPGVVVMVQNTSIATQTDIDGNYSITVPENTQKLLFSYLGFKNQVVNIGDKTTIDITMEEDIAKLGEVVVTGYQTLSEERVTGSFAGVQETQIQQRPSATSFSERIVGQVPGVNVNGNTGRLEIRGRSTLFNGYGEVLIVVDGFPLTRQDDFNTINPEDIESITVLKDAAAASTWGAKASNGVIVITTKTGRKNQKLDVNFSAFVDMEEKVDFDDMNWMTVSEEIDTDLEYIEKGWFDVATIPNTPLSINDLHLAEVYRSGASPDGNVWSQDTYDSYISALRKRQDVSDQFEDYLMRSAMRKIYNFSLSGGGENNTFFASMSYNDIEGQRIGESNDRLTFNLRDTYDFTDKIKFTAGMTGVVRQQENNGIALDMVRQLQAYDQLIDENGQYVQKYFAWNPWVSRQREAEIGSPMSYNVVEEQRNLDDTEQFIDLRADLRLDVDVFDGFTYSPSFRYERGAGNRDIFKSMSLPSHRNTINDFYVNGNYQIPTGSDYRQESEYYKGWTFRNNINYNKTFGDHEVTVFGGIDYQRRFTENSYNRRFGYDKQSTTAADFDLLALLRRDIAYFNGERTREFYYSGAFFDVNNRDNRFVSWYGNAGYSFKEKYLINGSYRVDQANIFGSDPDFRYKPTWSVGAGWELGKENFIQDIDWIDRLKLRGTYGLGGNSLGAASPYASAFSRTNTYEYSYFFSRLSIPANPQLKWEETKTTNLGIDYSFFNGGLSGSLDYYKRVSTDIYGRRSLDPTVGFTSATVNYVGIDNQGVELLINARVIDHEDFKWDLRANINYNENITTEFEPTTETADYLAGGFGVIEGASINNYFAYKFAGLNENGEATFYDKDGVAQHWSHDFDKDDLLYMGGKTPQHYGGISSTLTYKNLDLTVNLNYGAKFAFRHAPNYISSGLGNYNNNRYNYANLRLHELWAERWQQPGDEATTGVPRMYYNGVNPQTGLTESRFDGSAQDRKWGQSTFNTFKGDYLRVQDIILGYNLPQSALDRTFFKSLRFTAQVANPFLWVANDRGLDPTVGAFGLEQATQNLTRIIFGLRANL
ncbi:SusC/RagA family TonB-linked outer membrane protein [Robertkochia flava]|uniref:SusC/RagA family TonB-linked outer membrane protein n=1 Tax=Robertkochia flava TaxID=3447986 RepID=UPI001CCDFFC2|nr:SusC/RagA family TonB-linked outer membrane protein [Robertkochia marina]